MSTTGIKPALPQSRNLCCTFEHVHYGPGLLVLTHCTSRFGAKRIFRQIMLDMKVHLRSMRKTMREEKIVAKYPKSNFPPF